MYGSISIKFDPNSVALGLRVRKAAYPDRWISGRVGGSSVEMDPQKRAYGCGGEPGHGGGGGGDGNSVG